MGWIGDDPTYTDFVKEDQYEERVSNHYDHPKEDFISKIKKRAVHFRALANSKRFK